MLVANDAFGEAVKEVYEPDWPGRDKLIQYLEVCNIIKHQFLRKWVYLHHQKKSVRARDQGVLPTTINAVPGYFHRNLEENRIERNP